MLEYHRGGMRRNTRRELEYQRGGWVEHFMVLCVEEHFMVLCVEETSLRDKEEKGVGKGCGLEEN